MTNYRKLKIYRNENVITKIKLENFENMCFFIAIAVILDRY